jgi:hypothetical protein
MSKMEQGSEKLTKCACGAELPTHLLFALTSHTCSCCRHYVVDDPRTDDARFREEGTAHNPFV